MKNKNIGWSIFYSVLYILELLFLYALTVNITSFYVGYTGAWITLFTFMVFTGAILMYLLLNALFKNKKIDEDILKLSEWINIVIITLVGLYADIKVAPVILVLNVITCFLKGNIQKCFKVIVWFVLLIYLLYSYQFGWITLSLCMMLLFAQGVLYYPSIYPTSENTLSKKDVIVVTILTALSAGLLLITFQKVLEGIVHISNEGELFNIVRLLPYFICVCLVIIGIVYYKDKKILNTKYEFIIRQVSFGVLMVISSIVLIQASALLSLIVTMCLVSYYALEFILIRFVHVKEETFKVVKWIMMHCILCVVLVSAQNLYDGVLIDSSVVMMSAFMMYLAIVWNQYTSNTISIFEDEEEIEE